VTIESSLVLSHKSAQDGCNGSVAIGDPRLKGTSTEKNSAIDLLINSVGCQLEKFANNLREEGKLSSW